jgi:hypothetical protein
MNAATASEQMGAPMYASSFAVNFGRKNDAKILSNKDVCTLQAAGDD